MPATPESHPIGNRPKDDTFRDALETLERILGASAAQADPPDFIALENGLRALHARFRVHQATGFFNPESNPALAAAPQLGDDFTRLSGEHPRFLGMIDRLIRHVEAMPDRPAEDRDVFLLRVREMITGLRRHEAEEESLFQVALCQETGGES